MTTIDEILRDAVCRNVAEMAQSILDDSEPVEPPLCRFGPGGVYVRDYTPRSRRTPDGLPSRTATLLGRWAGRAYRLVLASLSGRRGR